MTHSKILTVDPTADYELLDCGEGEKLERYGKFILARPDPQALWHKRLPHSEWKKADAFFTRDAKSSDWSYKTGSLEKWAIEFGELKFYVKPTSFKHVGLFPEQVGNWDWMRDLIKKKIGSNGGEKNGFFKKASDDVEILNLFGYTGGASLACAQAGAKVVHVDSSKTAVTWARENALLSDLSNRPIRWIVEDARAFVKREVKRERKYDGILLDPPAFGHGPDSEIWKIEDHFLPLVDDCFKLLKNKPLFFLINGYSAGYSALAYENILLELTKKYDGEIEMGELGIRESRKNNEALDNQADKTEPRILPCGIFARWKS